MLVVSYLVMLTDDQLATLKVVFANPKQSVSRFTAQLLVPHTHHLTRIAAIAAMGLALLQLDYLDEGLRAAAFGLMLTGVLPSWNRAGLFAGASLTCIYVAIGYHQEAMRSPFFFAVTGVFLALASAALRFTYTFEGDTQFRNRAFFGGLLAGGFLTVAAMLVASDSSNPIVEPVRGGDEVFSYGQRAFEGDWVTAMFVVVGIAFLLNLIAYFTPPIRKEWVSEDRRLACEKTEYVTVAGFGVLAAMLICGFVDSPWKAAAEILVGVFCVWLVYRARELHTNSYVARKQVYRAMLEVSAALSVAVVIAGVFLTGGLAALVSLAEGVLAMSVMFAILGATLWVEWYAIQRMRRSLDAVFVAIEEPQATVERIRQQIRDFRSRR